MTRRQFQPTQGLLEDVMRKQAGSIEKAILEAVMNSVDADAEFINIVIEEDAIVIEDDGKGMTEAEVEEYFEKFGLKDDDIETKDFGKFRIGRGQIFNFGRNVWHSLDNIMVVDLDHDETELDLNLVDDGAIDGLGVINSKNYTVVLDTSGLSYNLVKASSDYDGCRVLVEPYQGVIQNVDDVILETENLIKYIPWVHGVQIEINGEEVYHDPEPDLETDKAWYVYDDDSYGSNTRVYNQGAFVTTERVTNSPGEIITKVDLDVNFARNDILDTDENIQSIYEEYKAFTVDMLTEQDNISSGERRWLLERAAEDEQTLHEVKDMRLIEDTQGHEYSISDLDGTSISFAPRGNKLAGFAMERTHTIVIDDKLQEQVEALYETDAFVNFSELVEGTSQWEMTEYDYQELSPRRQKNFDRAEWALHQAGFKGTINPGVSRHADAWKTSEDELFIDKAFLNQPKMDFIMLSIPHIIEVAAQSGDTRPGLSHGYDFKNRYWNLANNLGEIQYDLLKGNNPTE